MQIIKNSYTYRFFIYFYDKKPGIKSIVSKQRAGFLFACPRSNSSLPWHYFQAPPFVLLAEALAGVLAGVVVVVVAGVAATGAAAAAVA